MDYDKRKIDVACIANYPSVSSLKFLRKKQADPETNPEGYPINDQYFDPLYYSFLEVSGAIIAINSGPKDLLSPPGIKRARVQFISALNRVAMFGVKVVVLAASLKRLFGEFGEETIDENGISNKNGCTIFEMFPDVLFTNGDNGTGVIFSQEIDHLLSLSSVSKRRGRIGVLGAGILGIKAIKHLTDVGIKDNQIFVISSYTNSVKKAMLGHEGISVVSSIDEMTDNLDAIICCTHNNQLTADQLSFVDCKYVLDVSVPPGFSEEEYLKCRGVYRQDAGNAYSKNINYKFDPSGIDLGTTEEMYGCFAEGTVLGNWIISNGHNFNEVNLKDLSWFHINNENSQVVARLFDEFGFSSNPVPLCFGDPVSRI